MSVSNNVLNVVAAGAALEPLVLANNVLFAIAGRSDALKLVAIEILPAPLVIAIPLPAPKVPTDGAPPVKPISN